MRTTTNKKAALEQLLQQCLNGDHHAFTKLFKERYAELCVFSMRIVSDPCVAEEIVSDVLLKMWLNRDRIAIGTSVKAYLYTSIRNKAFDHLRSLKKDVLVDIGKATNVCIPMDGYQKIVERELDQRIEQAIDKLPSQCRLIFSMSRSQDMPYKAISQQLNISIKTVETQVGRALRKLRLELREDYLMSA
jgi:RNA polymerase sigma-70 factor (family 1)